MFGLDAGFEEAGFENPLVVSFLTTFGLGTSGSYGFAQAGFACSYLAYSAA